MRRIRYRYGFTIVEVLVAAGLLSILMVTLLDSLKLNLNKMTVLASEPAGIEAGRIQSREFRLQDIRDIGVSSASRSGETDIQTRYETKIDVKPTKRYITDGTDGLIWQWEGSTVVRDYLDDTMREYFSQFARIRTWDYSDNTNEVLTDQETTRFEVSFEYFIDIGGSLLPYDASNLVQVNASGGTTGLIHPYGSLLQLTAGSEVGYSFAYYILNGSIKAVNPLVIDSPLRRNITVGVVYKEK